MNEKEFIENINEMLDDYIFLEGNQFEFSMKNVLFEKIINLVKKAEFSYKMFLALCDNLYDKELLPKEVEDSNKNQFVFHHIRNQLIMDGIDLEGNNIFSDFPENFLDDSSESVEKDAERKRFEELSKIDGIENAVYYDIYKYMDIETLIRIRASNFMEQVIRDNSDSPNKEFLESIIRIILTQDDNYELLAIIEKAIGNYRLDKIVYLDGIEKEQGNYLPEILENKKLLNKLVQIMIKDPRNLFSINTVEDVENYEQIRKEECLKLLLGEQANVKLLIDVMPGWKRKKLALFELLYGIDYNQAKNLTEKYGSIGKIKARTPKEQVIIDFINSLKNLIELDDEVIKRMIDNPDFINFIRDLEPPEIASNRIIEKNIVAMYEREFNEKIADTKPSIVGFVEYKGKKIPVELITPIDSDGNFHYTEFSGYIRQEGIDKNWESPANYRDYYNIQSVLNHGDCRSYITQSQMAFWRKEAVPRVWYNDTGNIMYMAPWNITTEDYNKTFSPISVNWNIGKGIRFETPEELINNTRTGMKVKTERHGETVTDRIIRIDKNGITKLTPYRAVYIQEAFNENAYICTLKGLNEKDSIQAWALKGIKEGINITDTLINETIEFISNREKEWSETLRLAYEMNIPLRIIDREGFAIQEEMVIQRDIELLGGNKVESFRGIDYLEYITGKRCNIIDWGKKEKENLSREEIIREVLIRFENNAVGMLMADKNFEYFTDEKRIDVINGLMQAIDLNKKTNQKQYIEDLLVVEQFIREEKAKEQTSKAQTVYKISNAYIELEQEIDKRLVQIGERKPFIELDNLEELNHIINYIYDSKLYNENKLHSTDHIVKTVLFLNILGKKEGINKKDRTLLLIATALHDCGREEKDGNESHAVLSAEKAGKILRGDDSPFKDYNLTEDEIKMIQISIEYHEVFEENPGKIEIGDYAERIINMVRNGKIVLDNCIMGLITKNNLDFNENTLLRLERICALLKDADALDRDRITNPNEMTNIMFLHTKSAKDIRMLAFSNRLNDRVAKRLLKKFFEIEYTGDDEAYRIAREMKKDTNIKMQCLTKEEMYEVFAEMGIDLTVENQVENVDAQNNDEGRNKKTEERAGIKNPIECLRRQYGQSVTKEDVKRAIKQIVGDFNRYIENTEKAEQL